MEQITRYFVTRLLGRGTIQAIQESDGDVNIFVVTHEQAEQKFSFVLHTNANVVAASPLSKIALLYWLSRVAIAQLHLHGTQLISCEALILDASLKPWNGDLSERPFGGPTVGCKHLFTPSNTAVPEATELGS